MHAPTESCLSRCRCDEAWKSRPSLLVGMATSPQAIRSQTPASRPSLGLGASGTGRGLTTLTESTPAHFHAASQLLRRGRCAVARDAPRRRPWPPCRSASAPMMGRRPAVGRAHHCCLGHRGTYPGLLRLRAKDGPLLLRSNSSHHARTPPRYGCWSFSTLTGPRLRNPAPDRHAGSWTGQRHHPSRVITVPDQRRDPGPDHRHPARMTVPPPTPRRCAAQLAQDSDGRGMVVILGVLAVAGSARWPGSAAGNRW